MSWFKLCVCVYNNFPFLPSVLPSNSSSPNHQGDGVSQASSEVSVFFLKLMMPSGACIFKALKGLEALFGSLSSQTHPLGCLFLL